MSKAVTDILGRMQGNVLALKGMHEKLSTPTGPTNPTFEQLPPPQPMAAAATHEDYTFVQKLLKEIEAQAHDASAEIDRILQVPPQPGTEPPVTTPPPDAPAHQPAEAKANKK
jgi:hypothetical protein